MVKWIVVLVLGGLAVAGCPREDDVDYWLGFQVGLAEEDWYWEGYYDSWYSDAYEDFYEGDEIPRPASPAFDRGYGDGVWTVYNNGYYDAYTDAFERGFERGYRDANFAGWEQFLTVDEHVEYGTGGFDDGYNDGYSEGRVFGAWDYVQHPFLPDWEGALGRYRAGIRVCVRVETENVCSGEVALYQYGTEP